MFRIVFTHNFDKDFKKLDHSVCKRIVVKIKELEESLVKVKKLKYAPPLFDDLYKYKIGEWRVILSVNKNKNEITLHFVGHRKDIYGKLFR